MEGGGELGEGGGGVGGGGGIVGLAQVDKWPARILAQAHPTSHSQNVEKNQNVHPHFIMHVCCL